MVNSISIDSGGNSYIAGYYGATATFGSTTLMNYGNASDAFIAKISSTGAYLRAAQGGGYSADIAN